MLSPHCLVSFAFWMNRSLLGIAVWTEAMTHFLSNSVEGQVRNSKMHQKHIKAMLSLQVLGLYLWFKVLYCKNCMCTVQMHEVSPTMLTWSWSSTGRISRYGRYSISLYTDSATGHVSGCGSILVWKRKWLLLLYHYWVLLLYSLLPMPVMIVQICPCVLIYKWNKSNTCRHFTIQNPKGTNFAISYILQFIFQLI